VSKYIKTVKDQLAYHNIEEKKDRLKVKVAEGTWHPEDECEYERIDQIGVESALYAERQIARKYTKKYVWSPKLMQAVQGVRYWRLRLKWAIGLRMTDHILNIC
jgi:hypothetical protein